jgi:hypothetical protein
MWMGIPLQIWQSRFHTTPFDEVFGRDLQPAMEVWRGEDKIWFLPRPQNDLWVNQGPYPTAERIVCAESFDVVDIYHVDEARHMSPPKVFPEAWQNTIPSGFYRRWLQTSPDLIKQQGSLKMRLPQRKGNTVEYPWATLTCGSGPMVPCDISPSPDQEKSRDGFTMRWPPDAQTPAPVSIEMESQRFYGRLRREKQIIGGSAIDVIKTEHDPEILGIGYWFHWPEPFDRCFSLPGGGHDLWQHQASMRECIQAWECGQQDEAFRQAENMVNRLTGEIQSTMIKAWFLPKLFATDEKVY